MDAFSVRDALKFGWETFKKRPWMLIGGFALAMLISGIASALLDPGENAPLTPVTALMLLASFFIGLLVEMGLVTFALKAHDDVEKVQLADLWNPKPLWYYLAGQLIVGAIVIAGLFLLIVPGVIFALALMFTSYLIVDKGRGPIEALKESWRITKGKRWKLFLLALAVSLLNILGFLLLLVGLLVTIPVSMLAIVHVYRALEHSANELAPAA